MNNITIVGSACVGCRGCQQLCPTGCISMEENQEGFLYPVIRENDCIQCGRCLKGCPTQNEQQHRAEPKTVWAFRSGEREDLLRSASGGAADAATRSILKLGGVVYGAAYDDELVVRHIAVEDWEARKKLQSSKYVQSDLGLCYGKVQDDLKAGRIVLFTGTPCQVSGLYAFLGGDKKGLYTLDLICHGVPSPKLFGQYLKWMGERLGEQVEKYNFRSKDKRGWGTQYMLKTKTKTKTKTLALDRYGKHFMDGDCYRECCYRCAYANTERVADITVGDFWGIEQAHPDFFSPDGVSSVFVNTEKGGALLEWMREHGIILQSTLESGLLKQGNLRRPTKRPAGRDRFYQNIECDSFFSTLPVGLQLAQRLKAALPSSVVRKLKQLRR